MGMLLVCVYRYHLDSVCITNVANQGGRENMQMTMTMTMTMAMPMTITMTMTKTKSKAKTKMKTETMGSEGKVLRHDVEFRG